MCSRTRPSVTSIGIGGIGFLFIDSGFDTEHKCRTVCSGSVPHCFSFYFFFFIY